jgi:hypothetical protein
MVIHLRRRCQLQLRSCSSSCRFKGFKEFKGFKKFTRFKGSAYFIGGIGLAVKSDMPSAKDFTELIADEEHWAGVVLCKRAIAATVGLRRYLVTQQARANAKRIESDVERELNREPEPEPEPEPK